MRSDNLNPFIVSIFYITWIFLGNFILLNLFLAILLDSFLEEEEEGESEEELEEQLRLKHIRAAEKKKRKQANKVFMGDQSTANKEKKQGVETSKVYFGEAKANSEEDLEDLDEE